MNAGIVFLVGFIVVLYLTYRFFGASFTAALAKRIQHITTQLEMGVKGKEEVLKLLAVEHRNKSKIIKEIQLVKLKAEEEKRILKREMAAALSQIKREKRAHHALYLKRLSLDAQSYFIQQVAEMTLSTFVRLVREKNNKINHKSFNDKALTSILDSVKKAHEERTL